MGAVFRYILLCVATAAIAMFWEPFFAAVLGLVGVNTATWAGPVVDFSRALTGERWFQFSAVGVFFFAAGAWIDWVIRRFDGRHSEWMRSLADEMKLFSDRVMSSDMDDREIFYLFSIAEPIERDLESIGIEIEPSREGDNHATVLMRAAAAYLRMAPAIRRGDLSEAKKIATSLNKIIADRTPHQSNQGR